MLDMWGNCQKPWKLKWVKHIVYSNFYDPGSCSCVFEPSRNPQAAERFQVPPMGLPGWPGAPPFMPMPGENVSPAAVLNVEHHGLCWRFFWCHAHALVEQSVVVVGVVLLFGGMPMMPPPWVRGSWWNNNHAAMEKVGCFCTDHLRPCHLGACQACRAWRPSPWSTMDFPLMRRCGAAEDLSYTKLCLSRATWKIFETTLPEN